MTDDEDPAGDLADELAEARAQLAALDEAEAEKREALEEWISFLEEELDRADPRPLDTCLDDHAERAADEAAARREREGPLDRVRRLF